MSDRLPPPPPPPSGGTRTRSRRVKAEHDGHVEERTFVCPVEDCQSRTRTIGRQAWCSKHDGRVIEMRRTDDD